MSALYDSDCTSLRFERARTERLNFGTSTVSPTKPPMEIPSRILVAPALEFKLAATAAGLSQNASELLY